MKRVHVFTLAVSLALLLVAASTAQTGSTVKVEGYVLDSSCAYTKSLDKPISAACARSCAKAGSPLVILTSDGTVYWPISGGIPAAGQNQKLMPFAGEKVTVSGKVFERSGSKAIVIEKIERVASSKAAPAAH
jgi:type 1 fimbria pilin